MGSSRKVNPLLWSKSYYLDSIYSIVRCNHVGDDELPADVVKLISSGVCYATLVIPLLVLIPDVQLIPHFPMVIIIIIITATAKRTK